MRLHFASKIKDYIQELRINQAASVISFYFSRIISVIVCIY